LVEKKENSGMHSFGTEVKMANKQGRAWKMERASVNQKGESRARSNKYSHNDSSKRPAAGTRQRVWVGAYMRSDGTHVEGYYRSTPGQ
jgi:hypothetical protein